MTKLRRAHKQGASPLPPSPLHGHGPIAAGTIWKHVLQDDTVSEAKLEENLREIFPRAIHQSAAGPGSAAEETNKPLTALRDRRGVLQ